MIATKDSWKRAPFTSGEVIPFEANFSREEFARIREGLIPADMEDKWFIYFDEDLFLHRSWTGAPVFRVSIAERGDSFSVTKALCAVEERDQYGPEYATSLLNFLIRNLLLGENNEFPMPPGSGRTLKGMLQHAMSGTAFPEMNSMPEEQRPWWAFWRR